MLGCEPHISRVALLLIHKITCDAKPFAWYASLLYDHCARKFEVDGKDANAHESDTCTVALLYRYKEGAFHDKRPPTTGLSIRPFTIGSSL